VDHWQPKLIRNWGRQHKENRFGQFTKTGRFTLTMQEGHFGTKTLQMFPAVLPRLAEQKKDRKGGED